MSGYSKYTNEELYKALDIIKNWADPSDMEILAELRRRGNPPRQPSPQTTYPRPT